MSVESIITENLDIWTSAVKTKSAAGRGRTSKLDIYGIKKMRELILELAVRGKLVPQNPNDEPASELLKKIEAEKSRLVKEGKIKKQKQLPPVTEDEKPFELPDGSAFIRLGNIGNIFNGNSVNSRLKEQKYTGLDSGLPFIATKDVDYGYKSLDYNNGVLIPFDEPKFKIAHSNSVLICAEGGSAGKKCGIANQDICFGNKLFANELFGDVSSKFILYTYLSPTFFCQFSEAMTGIIGGISSNRFSELIINLPPLSEQYRIVSKVDELMALCDQLETETEASIQAHQTLVETLLATLTNAKCADELNDSWLRISAHFDVLFTNDDSIDQLKQTILQLAVMGKLVKQDPNDEPASKLLECIAAEKQALIKAGKIKKQKPLPPITEEEKPYALPSGWSWSRLQEITLLITDGKHGDCVNLEGSGYYFLSAKDIQNGKLVYEKARQIEFSEFSEVHQRTNLEPGDICMVNTGATIGKMALVENNDFTRKTTFQKSVAVIKVAKGYIYNRFAALFIQSETHNFLNKSGGSAINNLLLGDLKKKVSPVPPLEEQKRIVAKVDKLMALCDSLKAHLNQAQTTQLHLTDAIVEQVL
ncbi:restriction endonuclease subunit S [Neptunicella marina]|uniref:Restriction endonuclease subunit S n=1 Tax=Neptunicella marina TaxID=2125989 RepID=A0A8J6IUL2_9ALTE|nr:restriction endonuclease subunit S [Neptunicella marina]MBC3766981.1 restriction endonuclease subunit S [Neptunicella marina]